MIKIIDLYIVKKFLSTFFFMMGIIMLIAIIFDISEKLDDLIEHHAKVSDIILKYYVNFVLYFGNLFSSLLIFISVILFTAQMANRTEIVAILSSGVSFKRLLVPYFIAATFLTLTSLYLNNFVIPKSNKIRLDFEEAFIRHGYHNFDRDIHKQLEPGLFVYFESFNVNRNVGYKFALEKWENDELKFKLMSDVIIWDDTKEKWTVENYIIREIDGLHESLRGGAALDTVLGIDPFEFKRRLNNIETMDTYELNDFIEAERLKGSDLIPYYEIEKHQRTSLPFATYVLTLIAVSLSSRKVRGGLGMHLAIGLLIAVSYILALKVTSVFATNAGLDAMLAMWLPNIFYGILAIILLIKAPK